MLNAYWEYAGTRYKQKFQAIQASGNDFGKINFTMFANDSFDKLDWSIEPAQSLKSLMLTRALQLRDTYKYIKFFFSGGADSTTILNVFLDNDILIDEIIVYKYLENNDSNYEVDHFTIPYLKKIEQQLPHTKIKIFTTYEDYFEKYLTDKWFYTRSSLSARHYNFTKINGKNYCSIIGGADPYLELVNGTFHATFFDSNGAGELANYRNVELFYTTPDLPELHLKQCHMMKKHIKNDSINHQQEVKRNYLRDKPVAPEPIFLRKFYTANPLNPYQKDKLLFKENRKLLDQWRYILNTKINGIPVIRLPIGFCGKRYNLGS